MTKIAIIYFSGYGHTKKQAEAVRQGVESVPGVSVIMAEIDKSGDLPVEIFNSITDANAIIYGSPTYMGGPAWQFKKFADTSANPWSGQEWKNKIAGGFTNSASTNGDKFSTIQYFITLAMQHGQIWVGTGLKPSNKKENGPQDINWTAGFSGALAISPADASPDEAPRAGDLETARLYGERLARIAVQIKVSA